MEEKKLKAENIPWGYARCFNDACKRKDTCMHYLANVLTNHHGENKLTPKQQDDIMQILAQFGTTEGIQFDHYETDWNFG